MAKISATILESKIRHLMMVGLIFSADALYGVAEYEPKSNSFVLNPTELIESLSIPVNDVVEEIKIPLSKLKKRALSSGKDERIEPLVLALPKSESKLDELTGRLARPGKKKGLSKLIRERLHAKAPSEAPLEHMKVDANLYDLIAAKALADEMARPHHNVEVISSKLFENVTKRQELLTQLAPFLPREERMRIFQKMKTGRSLSLERDLLPEFARKMVRKFLVFRGPNCFHATLAFHGQILTQSPLVNVKVEKGYHSAMINYDELWRVLYSLFYEVDLKKSPLKYGDVLVFMNLPENGEPVNFRWIRHTAVYLFGRYTFSKGSKSPNTPYSVKTVEEEWKTWQVFSKKLGVKVFRRSQNSVSRALPQDLTDWIY